MCERRHAIRVEADRQIVVRGAPRAGERTTTIVDGGGVVVPLQGRRFFNELLHVLHELVDLFFFEGVVQRDTDAADRPKIRNSPQRRATGRSTRHENATRHHHTGTTDGREKKSVSDRCRQNIDGKIGKWDKGMAGGLGNF